MTDWTLYTDADTFPPDWPVWVGRVENNAVRCCGICVDRRRLQKDTFWTPVLAAADAGTEVLKAMGEW